MNNRELQKDNCNLVMNLIREKIDNGEWKSGSRIWTENEFVAKLKIPKPTVRQAIEKLCFMSILRKVQGSGTYVLESGEHSLDSLLFLNNSCQDLLDLLYFRLFFEEGVVELFIRNAGDRDFAAVKKYCDLMNENRGSRFEYYKNDFEFHRALARGTHNKVFVMIGDILFDILAKNQTVVQNTYIELGISNQKAYDMHDLLLESIGEKDLELARAVMHKHIYSAINALEAKIAGAPEAGRRA